jgi:hypothetical protein
MASGEGRQSALSIRYRYSPFATNGVLTATSAEI